MLSFASSSDWSETARHLMAMAAATLASAIGVHVIRLPAAVSEPRPVSGSLVGPQSPLGQSQTLSKQVYPSRHTLPHVPQLALSQQVETRAPLQMVSPSTQQSPRGQSQIPSIQVNGGAQALPQAPQ